MTEKEESRYLVVCRFSTTSEKRDILKKLHSLRVNYKYDPKFDQYYIFARISLLITVLDLLDIKGIPRFYFSLSEEESTEDDIPDKKEKTFKIETRFRSYEPITIGDLIHSLDSGTVKSITITQDD